MVSNSAVNMFGHFCQNLRLQNRSEIIRNQRLSYTNQIPGSWGYSPMTQECDLCTKAFDFRRFPSNVGARDFSQKQPNIFDRRIADHWPSPRVGLRKIPRNDRESGLGPGLLCNSRFWTRLQSCSHSTRVFAIKAS